MAWGDDFGGFAAAVDAAAAREEAEMAAMAEAEMAEEAEINAELGGIASGRNFSGDLVGRSSGPAPGGIGSGRSFPGDPVGRVAGTGLGGGASRPGFDFNDDAYGGSGLLGYDYNDDMLDDESSGLLDVGNRSGFTGGGMMDYSDMTGLTEDDLDQAWGRGSTRVYDRGGYNYSGDMNLAMAHAYDQRFSDPNHAWNTLTENEKRRVVSREQAGPSKIADIFNLSLDSRLNNLINSELGLRDPDDDRDDSASEYACTAAGGTWDGGSCVMPSDDDDDDDNGDIDYGKFGKPDPFASINRERQMWYHPMMGGTGHGNVYDPYSGVRPEWISESIWDYKPPRGGAEFRNWASDLRKWAKSGD